jgi:hypothetical protein
VVIFFRWCEAADDPIEQIGIGSIEQGFEPVELVRVKPREVSLRERAENKVAFLRAPVPAPEQEPLVADIGPLTLHPI